MYEQAKLLSKEFKAITADERVKWDQLAVEDKERYQKEMETYEPPSSDDEQIVRKKKQKKDPNAPKRNMSAYFLYSQVIRPTIKEEHPTATFGETAKVRRSSYKMLMPRTTFINHLTRISNNSSFLKGTRL